MGRSQLPSPGVGTGVEGNYLIVLFDIMDLDDLFGAFDGGEKAKDVHEATSDPTVVAAGKRRVDIGGVPGGGANKRQAVQQTDNSKSCVDGVEKLVPVADNEGEGIIALKEGEESSTVREDGTLVKSVSSTNCGQFNLVPVASIQCIHTHKTTYTCGGVVGSRWLRILRKVETIGSNLTVCGSSSNLKRGKYIV